MPEPNLFNLDSPAPSSAPQPAAVDGDPAVWTLLGETAPSNQQGLLAVASTIANRAAKSGLSYQDVVTDPANGYEAWLDPHARAATQQRYPVGSAPYQAAQQVLGDIQAGKTQPLPYTHFDSPDVLAARGQPEPNWTKGQVGTDIAGNRFYTLPDQLGGAEPDLLALGGVAPPGGVKGVPGAQYTPGSAAGKPPDPQTLAFSFLAQHGFRDEDAPLGSSTNPAGQVPGQGVPSEQGSWYITPQGQLRKTGDPTPDYLPQYEQVAAARDTAAKAPLGGRLATALGQGAIDVGASLNKLTGGLASAPTPGVYLSDNDALAPVNAPGGVSDQAAAANSLSYFQNERNQYDLLHHGDVPMAAARFVGQAAPVTAAGLATGGALDASSIPLLGDAAGSNPFLQGAARGVVQGAQAAGLTSSTSDHPLPEQLAAGAAFGGVLGGAEPAVASGFQRLITGAPLPAGPVTDLADTAINKFGIPLRAGQVRGAAGDRAAAYADSNLLSSSSKFAENNNTQRAAFMRGLTSSYGDPSGDVSPEGLSAAKARVVAPMNEVAGRTNIAADPVQTQIGNVIADAQKVLPDNEVAPLLKLAQSVGDVRSGSVIPGSAYQALTRSGAPLDRLVQSADPNVAHYASLIRGALDDGLQASAAPEDVAALQNARWQYKNLMTVAKLAPKADANGVISPALVRGAVNTKFQNNAFQGAGDLGELAQIGQTFMKEPPQSGTVPRAKDLLGPLSSLAGAGGEGAALFLHDPQLAIGTAAGVLGAKAVQKGLGALKETRLGAGAGNRLLNPPLNALSVAPYVLPSAVIATNPLLALPAANH